MMCLCSFIHTCLHLLACYYSSMLADLGERVGHDLLRRPVLLVVVVVVLLLLLRKMYMLLYII